MFILSEENGQFVTLIAHDNCSALQKRQLQNLGGITLILTNTQTEASIAIVNRLFNLIIIDLNLNGFDLVSLAKSASCINCNTPIIALTEKADSSQRWHFIAAGFDDCLIKPLTPDNLGETVNHWRESVELASPLCSIETLLAKCNNNRNLVLILYHKLFDELPQQINCIEEALKNGQHQLAFDVTHKINGSAKICCLQGIEESANALEKCLIQKRYDQAEGYFLMLQQGISVFINYQKPILGHLDRIL